MLKAAPEGRPPSLCLPKPPLISYEPGAGVYYGGEVAAPVFSQVVQQTLHRLGVLPDIEVQSQIQTSIPSEVESF